MSGDSDDLAQLRLLQLADSGFPSGAYTLSHGLETLVADGTIAGDVELAAFVRVQLLSKFARSDLIALLAAHGAGGGPASEEARPLDGEDPGWTGVDRLVAIDRRLTAAKLAADDRIGSARVGRRLAAEVARLAPDPALVAFLAAIADGRTSGNAAVAFGLAGRALGVDSHRTALAASSAMVIGLVAAAVRLGLIGHGAAQRMVADAASDISAAVELAGNGDWRELSPSAPQIEVALARHETSPARQFAS